jgi:glycosyltransferase involved in cell wall biosynthesis
MDFVLIIPILNEAECLHQLLAEVPAYLQERTIVVDNGSTDGSGEIAQRAGFRVIHEPRRGYGYACLAGALAASGEILVFMDGDGSFLPGETPTLAAPVEQDLADLVLGSRVIDDPRPAAMPSHQLLGNRLVVWLLQKRFRLQLTDLGPYRAIPRDLLLSLQMQELTYGWSLEMIIKAARLGKRLVEFPITYRPRFAGKSKVGGSLRGTILVAYRFFRIFTRYAF